MLVTQASLIAENTNFLNNESTKLLISENTLAWSSHASLIGSESTNLRIGENRLVLVTQAFLIDGSTNSLRRLFFYSNSRRTFMSGQPYVQEKNGSKTEHVRL